MKFTNIEISTFTDKSSNATFFASDVLALIFGAVWVNFYTLAVLGIIVEVSFVVCSVGLDSVPALSMGMSVEELAFIYITVCMN